jgi:hypothetical protein
LNSTLDVPDDKKREPQLNRAFGEREYEEGGLRVSLEG